MEDGVMILIKILLFALAISVVPMTFNLCKDAWKDSNIYDKVCMFAISFALVLSAWTMLYYCFK